MAQETSMPRTTTSGPDLGRGEPESTADPPPGDSPVGRARLDRLLSVVVLSPAQASLVAVQLLDAIHVRGTGNGARPADGLWAVTLTPAGDVDVGRARAGEGARVTELLEQLSQNARRLPAHPRSEHLVLLRKLEEAAADPQAEPAARARELEGTLAEVLGPSARQRLSGQLAALVAAFARIAPSVATSVDPPGSPEGSRPEPHRAAPARSAAQPPARRGRRLSHRRPRPRRMALALVLLLAVGLAGSGYVVLRSPDLGIADAPGRETPDAPPTNTPPDTSNEPTKRPREDVAALAGRRAGPITAVDLSKADGCVPGSLCPVTVTVHFRPASTSQAMVWKVGAARLCGSGITWSPPVTVTAQPGWSTVYASSSVRVPQGRSLALVALTTSPARAQSPPVPVTGSSLRC